MSDDTRGVFHLMESMHSTCCHLLYPVLLHALLLQHHSYSMCESMNVEEKMMTEKWFVLQIGLYFGFDLHVFVHILMTLFWGTFFTII